MNKRVLVVVAHDDDSILGVGGRIMRHIAEGDEVSVLVCHDGRTSHRAVFQREERPSLQQVGEARRAEFAAAMKILGVTNWEILNLPGEEGRPSQNLEILAQMLEPKVIGIGLVVYYHMPDAHPDHRAVAEAVRLAIRLRYRVDFEPDEFAMTELFRFMIWNEDLAKSQGQTNMEPSMAPAVPSNAERFILTAEELARKRQVLSCMKSQVKTRPYPDWDPQPRPILTKEFVEYFLRGEEIFIPA